MYSEQLMMLLAVFERAALMLMTLFLLTRTQLFQSIVKKTHRRPVETAMISSLFILFAVFSTYTGLKCRRLISECAYYRSVIRGHYFWAVDWYSCRYYS